MKVLKLVVMVWCLCSFAGVVSAFGVCDPDENNNVEAYLPAGNELAYMADTNRNDCRSACEKIFECKGWTWKENYFRPGECWLKNGVESPVGSIGWRYANCRSLSPAGQVLQNMIGTFQ